MTETQLQSAIIELRRTDRLAWSTTSPTTTNGFAAHTREGFPDLCIWCEGSASIFAELKDAKKPRTDAQATIRMNGIQ